ncbi:MAG TPA: hypothetical protein VLQ93_08660 [Myxococcaceae bacterium]|nr:hypothetical protein [Myxococcaceae bacterium]
MRALQSSPGLLLLLPGLALAQGVPMSEQPTPSIDWGVSWVWLLLLLALVFVLTARGLRIDRRKGGSPPARR